MTTSTVAQNLALFGSLIGLSNSADPRAIIANIIRIALTFAGFIFFLQILWTGVLFLFSGGRDEHVVKAKKTFINALIGLVIILLARSIVSFVVNALVTATTQK